MPYKYDMEWEGRPSQSDMEKIEVEEKYKNAGACPKCKGWGVQFYTIYVYDENGDPDKDVGEEPCEHCEGRGR